MHIIEHIHIIMHRPIFSTVAGQVESVIEIRNIFFIFHAMKLNNLTTVPLDGAIDLGCGSRLPIYRVLLPPVGQTTTHYLMIKII